MHDGETMCGPKLHSKALETRIFKRDVKPWTLFSISGDDESCQRTSLAFDKLTQLGIGTPPIPREILLWTEKRVPENDRMNFNSDTVLGIFEV